MEFPMPSLFCMYIIAKTFCLFSYEGPGMIYHICLLYSWYYWCYSLLLQENILIFVSPLFIYKGICWFTKLLCTEIKILHYRLQEVDGSTRYTSTQLGCAVLASGLSPDEGLHVFSELHRARKCFVLENELHIIYQVCNMFIFPDNNFLQKNLKNQLDVVSEISCC